MVAIQFLPNFPERPTNPARTNIRTGDIEINSARWVQLSPEEREFVLQHEIGHYKLQTFNEVAADRYALNQLACKKPYSLINYLNAVSEISYNNAERVSAAQFDTLRIAAHNGSKEAKQLLSRYNANADGNRHTVNSNRWVYFATILFVLAIIFLIVEINKI